MQFLLEKNISAHHLHCYSITESYSVLGIIQNNARQRNSSTQVHFHRARHIDGSAERQSAFFVRDALFALRSALAHSVIQHAKHIKITMLMEYLTRNETKFIFLKLVHGLRKDKRVCTNHDVKNRENYY
jgi:hypothetical protein